MADFLVLGAIPALVLFVFCALAVEGVHRSWSYPITRALLVVWTIIGVVSFVATLGEPEPEGAAQFLNPAIRFTIVALLDALVMLVPAAAAFYVCSSGRIAFRVMCAIVAGVLAVPIAAGAGLFLSCMFGLGCL